MYTYLQQALPRVVIHLTKEAKKKWKLRARFSPTKENRLHQTKIVCCVFVLFSIAKSMLKMGSVFASVAITLPSH